MMIKQIKIIDAEFHLIKPLRLIVVLGCLFFIAACQNVPKSEVDVKPGGNQLVKNSNGQYTADAFSVPSEVRKKVAAWDLSGSFSYVDPKESGAGRIQWKYQGRLQDDFINNESVRLIGPIGTGSVELVSSETGAHLISGKQRYFGTSADKLLIDIVGWKMPVEEMRYWLFGMPSTKVEGRFWLNEQGGLQSLKQSDWEIQFERYQVVPELNAMLPQKITAIHRSNQAKVKLIIKRFQAQLQ